MSTKYVSTKIVLMLHSFDYYVLITNLYWSCCLFLPPALLIGATCYAICCKKLWLTGYDKTNKEDDWASIVECPNFDKHMRLYRFKEFKKIIPLIYE